LKNGYFPLNIKTGMHQSVSCLALILMIPKGWLIFK